MHTNQAQPNEPVEARKKFPVPKSLQMIRKRCNKPLIDNHGVFKTYMFSVNVDEKDLPCNTNEEMNKLVAKGLRFEIQTIPCRTVGPFIINW